MNRRRVAHVVGLVLFPAIFFSQDLPAAVIPVDGTTCSLGNAILSANGDSAIGGCAAGAGADTLVLGVDVVLTAPVTAAVEGGPSGLPAVSSSIVIEAGAGSILERSDALTCADAEPSAFRILEVGSGGDLTLAGLTLRNGCIAAGAAATSASGGAILVFAGGKLHVDQCAFTGSTARGGPVGGASSIGAGRGGAIAVLGGTLAVVDSTFAGNEAIGNDAHGGAVAVEEGVVGEISWSRFEGNRALPIEFGTALTYPASGGAISLRGVSAGSLRHLVIAGNLAGRDEAAATSGGPAEGGGLAASGSFITELRDVLFADNVARAHAQSALAPASGLGGGVWSDGSIDSIVRATFTGNRALGFATGMGRGGGLDNTGRIGRIASSTFVGNVAQGRLGHLTSAGSSLGGGLANAGAIGMISASTFVGNQCPRAAGFPPLVAGGGIYDATTDEAGAPALTGGVPISDSLFSGNEAIDPSTTGGDCFSTGGLWSNDYNLVEAPDGSCFFGLPGDTVGEDPLTLPLADNGCTVALPGGGCLPTVAISTASPAADAGRCFEAGIELDARGAVRPFDLGGVPNAAGGDGCDIGAFEADGEIATVHVGLNVADSADPVVSGVGPGNLAYTVSVFNLGSSPADGVVVSALYSPPPGVSAVAIGATQGNWNGGTWDVGTLASGASAELTFLLTVGFGTAGGTDMLSLPAAVIAASGHDGEFPADVERTSVIEGVFFGNFESGDTSIWSQTVGGG